MRGAKRGGGARRRRVRRVGCNRHVQPATLHAGVRHMIRKAGAHEGSTALHGGHGTAKGCTTHVVCVACVMHPSAWCVVQVGRAAHLFGRCRGLHCTAMQADGGVGRAPCRRGSSPAPASAKTMADGTDWQAVGAEKCGIKRGGWWGHWCGDAPCSARPSPAAPRRARSPHGRP